MWNYRVFKKVYDTPENLPEEDRIEYQIREVYYNDSKEIISHMKFSSRVGGSNLNELKQGLLWMLEALEKDVLEEGKIVFGNGNAHGSFQDHKF